MNLFIRVVIISISLCSLTGCKGNYNIDSTTIDSGYDFSVKDKNAELSSIITHFQNEKEKGNIKVVFNNKIYTFERFNKKIGFKNIKNLQVVKDTETISKYKIKNCKVLLLVK